MKIIYRFFHTAFEAICYIVSKQVVKPAETSKKTDFKRPSLIFEFFIPSSTMKVNIQAPNDKTAAFVRYRWVTTAVNTLIRQDTICKWSTCPFTLKVRTKANNRRQTDITRRHICTSAISDVNPKSGSQ